MLASFSPSYKQITIDNNIIKMPSNKIVSFKRTSDATYINKSEILTIAKVDKPQFEQKGLLIKEQKTNYHLNSLTPSKWEATTSITITKSDINKFSFTYRQFQIKNKKIGTNTTINIAAISEEKSINITKTKKYITTSYHIKSNNTNIQCHIKFKKYDKSTYFYLANTYLNITNISIRKTEEEATKITAQAKKKSNG